MDMDNETRKQIAFDLDTKQLEIYYPKRHWQSAYDDIKNFMKKNGFEWRQGSVYISKDTFNIYDVSSTILHLVQNCSWLNKCMRDCVVTNIGKSYSQNDLFDKNANIKTRAELEEEKNAAAKEVKTIVAVSSFSEFVSPKNIWEIELDNDFEEEDEEDFER